MFDKIDKDAVTKFNSDFEYKWFDKFWNQISVEKDEVEFNKSRKRVLEHDKGRN